MEIKVDHVEELTTFSPPLGSQKVIRTTYHVGTFGPFTVDLKVADYNVAAVKAEMERTAATIRGLC